MTWPNNIPPDLRQLLESVLSHRSVGAAEVWGEVRDWLIKHGVQPPERLQEGGKAAGMAFYRFDVSELAVVNHEGMGMVLTNSGVWRPDGGSRATALEILGDHRAREISGQEAEAELRRRGAAWPRL